MADLADLNPAFLPLLNAYTGALDKAGIGYRVDSGYRTPELQAGIYTRSNQGRSFAAAPAWRSFHNYGLAADVIPNNPADYARMHDLARQAGLYDAQSGLGFTGYDPPHVEMPGSLSNLINQYHLANWRPESMPAPATGAIAYAGPSGQPSRVGSTTPGTSLFSVPQNAPMGMRNNNPLNIKWYKDAPYEGLVGPSANTDQGDPQMVFKTPEAGWSAAYSLLNKKYGSGMTTPNMIIAGQGGWTPGNKQAALNVAKAAGIGPDDDIGFSNSAKAQKFMRALVQQEQGGASSAYPDAMIASAVSGKPIGTTLGAPTAAAGATPAAGAPGQPAAPTGGPLGQLASALKPLTGDKGAGGGQTDEPQPMHLQQAQPSQAMGGPMMMQPGGQNMEGRQLAAQDLAQRGYSMQPQLASTYGALGATKPVGQPMMPGQATGIPALMGTTLNSPSQLQMALMSGQLSPYDAYANAGYGGGYGSS